MTGGLLVAVVLRRLCGLLLCAAFSFALLLLNRPANMLCHSMASCACGMGLTEQRDLETVVGRVDDGDNRQVCDCYLVLRRQLGMQTHHTNIFEK